MKKMEPVPGQHAPAVARAVLAVEHLAAAEEPCSLSRLSRELGIGPSSLLTILAPLRAAGVVVRDADGRYALGPTLIGLGEAAARACTAAQLFERIAGPLVDRTGETALLWSACGDGFALAAAREGRHPLRFVPTVGLRLGGEWTGYAATADGHGLVEGELLPDVWMIAAPLAAGADPTASMVALAGPVARLRRADAASLGAALRDAVAEVTPSGQSRTPTSESSTTGLPVGPSPAGAEGDPVVGAVATGVAMRGTP
ncbi:MAG: hypothetical protein M3O34_08730, partial [Chloroflexota bacterium]|nr:hypothetical protein [Chloroflexota bacterium]